MNLSQLLAALFASIKNQVVLTVAPDLITFLSNTSKLDPTSLAGQLGYVAQLDLLRSSLAAGLTTLAPGEVQSVIQTIDNEFETALQSALTKAEASQAAAAAAPAATATAAAAKA